MNNLRNSVQLIGHLGSNPELTEFENGKKYLKVSIATKEVYHNSKGEKIVDTTWHHLVAWGKVADNMEVTLRKGNEVLIQGRLQNRTYEDRNGIKRQIYEVMVLTFMLLTKTTNH